MNEFDEKLITLVENYPHLYNKCCLDFKDDKKKANSWRTIAESLDCDENSVKKRWDNIRDRFVRCHRVVTDKSGAGVADIPKLNFPFYDMMRWLIPYVRKRKATIVFFDRQSRNKRLAPNNHTEEDTEEDNFSQIYIDDGLSGPNFRAPVTSQDSSLSCSPPPAPEVVHDSVNQAAQSLITFLNQLRNQAEPEDSADMCFAKSLANDMKMIKARHKKIKFKREVLQLLEKYVDDS